ncbi:MAG: NINE protein [Phycisphaerae bacterium]
MRSIPVAYILWVLLGPLGVHRFYCGKIGTGLLWFFTAGLVGIGWLIDVFLIPDMVREANATQPPLFGSGFSTPDGGPYAVPTASAGVSANRVIYCTQCGGSMQVPAQSVGRQYACPRCRTVLEVPA